MTKPSTGPSAPAVPGAAGPVAEHPADRPGGRLVLAATPIGDPLDASPRLAKLLAEADLIAAEDTRRLRRLTTAMGVVTRGRVISYHEHNEAARGDDLLAVMREGGLVLLVTDAGMPGVSDPGLRAVRAAHDAGLPVTAVPGPSAALTALALSGLATDRFCFEGFPPRTPGRRRTAFTALAAERRTMIFFESPRRTASTLTDMASAFGADRPAAVCRELTKTHEQVRRAVLGELAAWAGDHEILGEVTIVVGGAPVVAAADLTAPDAEDLVRDLTAQVRALRAAGHGLRQACALVAEPAGLSTNDLYRAITAS
jgi:16S rRNA (cytidine1402-2'-O)-methyltransferase